MTAEVRKRPKWAKSRFRIRRFQHSSQNLSFTVTWR